VDYQLFLETIGSKNSVQILVLVATDAECQLFKELRSLYGGELDDVVVQTVDEFLAPLAD